MRYVIAFFLSGVVLIAQAEAPTLNSEQLARLDAYEAKIEAAQSQLALAQMRLEKTVREAQGYIQSLKKDDYVLQRTEQGWVYNKETKK